MSKHTPFILNFESGATMAIEPIASIAELKSRVSNAEMVEAEQFSSPSRRAERLASRALIRQILEIDTEQPHIIEYDAIGAPHLINSPLHISISHSRTLVAIVVSPTPCAIDIESTDRNFARVAERYISSIEATMMHSDEDYARLWCAKEALYKYSTQRELSLHDDIRITQITPTRLVGEITGINHPITITTQQIENHIVAYII